MPSRSGRGGYGVAMLVGIGLIMAAVGTLLSLVLKKGWCLIYLQTAKDLDVSAVEAEMQANWRRCAHSAGRTRARSAAEPGDAARCRRRRWIKQPARRMIEVRSSDIAQITGEKHEPLDHYSNTRSTRRNRYIGLRAGETRCGHDEGFGGTYQVDCANNASPKATMFPDALVFLHGDKRVAGSKPQAQASFYGNSPPPEYRIMLVGEVAGGGELYVCDSSGQVRLYLKVDGDQKVVAAIG